MSLVHYVMRRSQNGFGKKQNKIRLSHQLLTLFIPTIYLPLSSTPQNRLMPLPPDGALSFHQISHLFSRTLLILPTLICSHSFPKYTTNTQYLILLSWPFFFHNSSTASNRYIYFSPDEPLPSNRFQNFFYSVDSSYKFLTLVTYYIQLENSFGTILG